MARLEERDADVLLLGVGFDRCSCFHLAEYRVPGAPQRQYAAVVADDGGVPGAAAARRWYTYQDVDLDDSDFGRLGLEFEVGDASVRRGCVGAADARLFPIRAAVAFAVGWLSRHREPHRASGENRPAHDRELRGRR